MVSKRSLTIISAVTAAVLFVSTSACIPRAAPAPSKRGGFDFIFDYENFNHKTRDELSYVGEQGGSLLVIADPTGSGRGFVQQSIIEATGKNPPVEERPNLLVHRLYPAQFFAFQPAPCDASLDIWVSQELLETAKGGDNRVVVGPDVFDKSKLDGGSWHSALQAVLVPESWVAGNVYLRLRTEERVYIPLAPDAPAFTTQKWHTIKISIAPNKTVTLFQDGQLLASGALPPTSRAGTVGGHPGLYAYNSTAAQPLTGWMLVDNWEIHCW